MECIHGVRGLRFGGKASEVVSHWIDRLAEKFNRLLLLKGRVQTRKDGHHQKEGMPIDMKMESKNHFKQAGKEKDGKYKEIAFFALFHFHLIQFQVTRGGRRRRHTHRDTIGEGRDIKRG